MIFIKFIDKLERKFGRFAIPGLLRYIVLFNAVVFLLTYIPRNYSFISMLYLDPSKVLQGQIWRVVTFLFIPGTFSPLWVFFQLYILYFISNSLEMYWGSFRLNLYYLIGVLATIIVSLSTGLVMTSSFVTTSIFLAFAFINPELEFLLFFVIPMKVKYLAYIQWGFIGYSILFKSLPYKLSSLCSVIAFFIFFGPEIINKLRGRRTSYKHRQKFKSQMPNLHFEESSIRHKCEVCGVTDKDDPNMEFRYCSKCSGLHEYCIKHISNHEHIK